MVMILALILIMCWTNPLNLNLTLFFETWCTKFLPFITRVCTVRRVHFDCTASKNDVNRNPDHSNKICKKIKLLLNIIYALKQILGI